MILSFELQNVALLFVVGAERKDGAQDPDIFAAHLYAGCIAGDSDSCTT